MRFKNNFHVHIFLKLKWSVQFKSNWICFQSFFERKKNSATGAAMLRGEKFSYSQISHPNVCILFIIDSFRIGHFVIAVVKLHIILPLNIHHLKNLPNRNLFIALKFFAWHCPNITKYFIKKNFWWPGCYLNTQPSNLESDALPLRHWVSSRISVLCNKFIKTPIWSTYLQ